MEVKKKREGSDNVKINWLDGVCLSGKEEVNQLWKSHFERLMNAKTKGNNSVEHGYGSGWKVCV